MPHLNRSTPMVLAQYIRSPGMAIENLETACCIVGGGPAGMMLGYLLARAGVAVVVLEKHADFFRDFRGDTVHPSTLEVMNELGLLDDFLKVPHQRLASTGGVFGNFAFQAANFTRLPTRCKFVVLMPQWDFLSFLSGRATRFQSFDLRMEHEAVGLVRENGRIVGVKVRTPTATIVIRAQLVVACDGRHSTIRKAAQLAIQEFGVPIDVLWFRMSRTSDDPEQLLGNVNYGRALVLIPRDDYFQAGLLIRKNSFEQVKAGGLERLRDTILRIAPYLGNRVDELQDWEQIKLLSVRINRLQQWYRPGLLCLGDAAHAMSPVGGVGINLAIQDAVAAANLLARPLRGNAVTESVLARVQKRREFPTRATQFAQMTAHNLLNRVFQDNGPIQAPWQLKAALFIPGLQHTIGRAVGIGIRPEHVAGANSARDLRRLFVGGMAFCAGALACATAVSWLRIRRPAESPGPTGTVSSARLHQRPGNG